MEGLRTLFQDDDCWGLASERHVGRRKCGRWKSRSWGEARGPSRGRVGGGFVVGVGRRWGWIVAMLSSQKNIEAFQTARRCQAGA